MLSIERTNQKHIAFLINATLSSIDLLKFSAKVTYLITINREDNNRISMILMSRQKLHEICSNLTIRVSFWCLIVNFEQIS